MCVFNACSLTTIPKRAHLLDYLIVNQIDITFITETWFDETLNDKVASLFGQYTVIGRRDRCNGPRGGVIALKKLFTNIDISNVPLLDRFDFACAFLLNSRSETPVLLLLIYLPPSKSPYSVSASDLSACIDSLFNTKIIGQLYPEPKLCILGDINLPKTQWKTMTSSVDYE